MKGRNELVENNTDSDVIGVFIEEFYGNDLVERYLAIGISMSCSLIHSGDCEPCPAFIYDEALLTRISIVKQLEGVPALVTDVYWDVEIENLEDISIC